MGLYAFKRLREREAASKEVASFSNEQERQQEAPVAKLGRGRPKRQPIAQDDVD